MAVNSYRQDEQITDTKKSITMLRLFRYLLNYKARISAVLVLMGFCIFVSLMNPLFLQKAVDTCIAHQDVTGLLKLISTAAVLNIAMVLAVKARMYLMATVSNKVIEEIRQELYDHIQTLDLKFFDSRPTGKILARVIGDVNSLKDVIENSVTTMIPDLATVICVAAIMFVKNAPLAAAALWSLPFMIAGIFIIQKQGHRHWQQFRKKSSNLNAFINEDLSGIKIIQSFNAEKETDSIFSSLVQEHRQSFIGAVRWGDAFGSVIDLCWGLGTLALYYVGIRILGIGNVSVGTYIAFGTYISMFWQPIMNLSNFYNQLTTTISGAERIFEIMDTPAEIQDDPEAPDMPAVNGTVEFDHVTFSYDKNKVILNDVSFTVRQGETVALVGPTGAGKSTIVNLVSRFYDPDSGAIRIDGTDIRSVRLASLRSQMGIMTQDNYIFSGTIRENIRYGNLNASDEEIIQAAKAVHADDFVRQLEKGYDTVLTARGGELSNGQRQLIAFARTMLSMPRILILDEATSSIDTQTEQQVQAGITELLKGRTSFVIAHRLSTIQDADFIFVVDNGGIAEKGTPAELMAARGTYYNLYTAQFSMQNQR
ncbi:MAG: ABC transporter ATP-binding protein/permease [Treponema sp.]|jgi:ATP-binding cassette subfamily B protein|nr:ABC transporter ATP-binding protein/permease [Treponema sp.]